MVSLSAEITVSARHGVARPPSARRPVADDHAQRHLRVMAIDDRRRPARS
jgi:hypothetical protein